MADINNTKQLNYSAEDINTLLNKIDNMKEQSIDTSTLKNEIISELSQDFQTKLNLQNILTANSFYNNRVPTGKYLLLNNIIKVKYSKGEDTLTESINDFIAFIGILNEYELITSLEYNGTEYTWGDTGYINDSNESIEQSVEKDFNEVLKSDQYSASLKLDNIPITYLIVQI